MTTTHLDITEALATEALDAARDEARERGVAMSIAVVDRGGHLVAARRMDDAQLGAMPLALDKAYTAILFRAPSDEWADSTGPGAANWGMAGSVGGRVQVMPGGHPIMLDDQVVGGIGVSGGPGEIDRAVAEAGAAAVRMS